MQKRERASGFTTKCPQKFSFLKIVNLKKINNKINNKIIKKTLLINNAFTRGVQVYAVAWRNDATPMQVV